jgi:hypothetical protein
MERYKNLEGHSGVTAFETGSDSIAVEFNYNAIYRYTYKSAGRHVIERMKKLAKSGRGLSTYISQTVRDKFDKQLK